ncbi:MAG: S41 family peptidase [Acidobacteriota bacterium]|jgi:carboxyl-terminal processing protease
MFRRTRLLALLTSTPLLVLVLVGGMLGAARPAIGQQGFDHLPVFWDVVRLTLGAYVEPPDVDRLMDGAMRGLTDGLDAASSYLTPEEVRAFDAGTPLPPADTGITVTKQYYLRVVGLRDDSPAARAGIRSGDFIRAIDDVPTRDMSVHAGTRMLAGAPGSSVTLLVIRSNAAEPRPIVVTREVASTERVSSRRLPGGEAYVRIDSFGDGVVDQLRQAIGSLGAAADAGLIIDIRNTADGPLDHGIDAARLFVDAGGRLAARQGREGAPEPVTADQGDGVFTMPVVLLVSNGTGGAAELFAAALADNGRATLVGMPTAGIAGEQTLVRLPDDHGLLLTTARWVRADDTPIHGQGLRPDVLVEVPIVPFDEEPPATDAVLERAVTILSTRKS